jgi:hypothetical protein
MTWDAPIVRRARIAFVGITVLVIALAPVTGVAAHGPAPAFPGTLWAQDQRVDYRWRSGQVPPDWMKGAINAAADDSNDSRQSRAALLSYDSAGSSLIGYDEPTGCGELGAACTSRAGAPNSFVMYFRRQGYMFDWGALRWCQAYQSAPNGCYDAESIGLHEFGHVQILDHHQMYSDMSDYGSSIMEALARSKPTSFYNRHTFASCDVATLQRKYDVSSSTSPIALCQSLDTTLTFSASGTSIAYQGPVVFTAVLRISSVTGNGRLSANPLSGRRVSLQRRVPGTTSWYTAGTMSDTSSAGSYSLSQNPGATYEWRAVFSTPTDEGLQGALSSGVVVDVAECTGQGCPSFRRD